MPLILGAAGLSVALSLVRTAGAAASRKIVATALCSNRDAEVADLYNKSMSKDIDYRAARLARGITQVDLSRRVGVTQQQISHIETGRGRPGPGTRIRLARVLGLPGD